MTGRSAADVRWLAEVGDLRILVESPGGAIPLVDRVSLQVAPGEALGVVGESGCGKTLSVLAMAGLVPPGLTQAAGSVASFRGRPVGENASDLLGREIGVVFQDPSATLNPVLRVGDQISEVVHLVGGAAKEEARMRTLDLLSEVGIEDPESKARRYPSQLSGGEKQRVGIAIALAADPSLLVADEPTTGLDVIVQAQILSLLDRLRKTRGMALVMVSHDLSVVAEVCDRVAVLYAGEVVEEGAVDAVLSRPRHPYTRGLLDCLPRLGEASAQVVAIPGSVPSPGRWPDGCRFRDRCAHSFERCGERPPLLPDGDGHAARCWLGEGRSDHV